MPNKYIQTSWKSGENPPQFMCSTTDFERTTTEEDGTVLITVDESGDKIDSYYMAFKGKWRDM